MSDRKAVNRYYPPDFDPQKHKSINKYRNSHPLRERAKRLSEGILVIRFEMPYNIWCEGCGKHVGMGVRYNAEKKKIGNYYSTPIYQFRMKCHLCDNYYVIETDPQNCDYKIIEGARRKNQKWDMADNEQVLTEDREVIKKRSRDPMYKLEHGVQDGKKLKAVIPTLSQMEDMQESWKEDYMQNKMLRNKFREEKKLLKIADEEDKALLSKSSLDIQLLKESEEDMKLASLMKYNVRESFDDKQKHKREEIKSRPLFTSPKSAGTILNDTSPPNSLPSNRVRNLQDVQRRLGLDKVKTSSTAGFGDFEAPPAAHKRAGKSLSSLGIVVKKKRMLVSNVSSDISSKSAGGQKDKTSDQTNVQELSNLTGDRDEAEDQSRTNVQDLPLSSVRTERTNVQDLTDSDSMSRPEPTETILASDTNNDPSHGAVSYNGHQDPISNLHHNMDNLSSRKTEKSCQQETCRTVTSNVHTTNKIPVSLCDYTSSSDSE